MKPLTFLAVLITFLVSSIGLAIQSMAADPTLVKLDSGFIRGIEKDNLLSFKGIPYAAAPVGKLRWMPPQQHASWTYILDATSYGNVCPQNNDLGVFGKAGGQEDCLNLNVFVGKEALESGKKLPVFFWIHGGSLWVGAGQDYDPTKLALDGQAVVVTINYRLGLLGYFAHPELEEQGANFGFMDQQLALDWVQRNISAFGGDPDNVTISGESSGGNSVMSHIVAPGSAGKFQHAIAMSGAAVILKYPTFGAPKPLSYAEELAARFASENGCDNDQAVQCLQNLPVGQVLATQTPYLVNQLIVDGKQFPEHPADALKNGHFNHVTFVNGTTRDEGSFFAGFVENETGAVLTPESFQATMRTFYDNLTDEVIKEYPLSDYLTPSNALAASVTDMQFACPAQTINGWVARQMPTYAYEFADRTAPSYLEPTTFSLGAAHTYELPYLFPGFHGGAGIPVTLNSQQQALSDKMVRFWANAGDIDDVSQGWPQYDPAQSNYMTFVLPQPVVRSMQFAREHHCDFWDNSGIYQK